MPIRLKNARILMYSHDTFGLGHLRRCRAIAVRYQVGAQDATLRFDLVDFDLMRRDEQAADPQIEQKLSAPATATKLDL